MLDILNRFSFDAAKFNTLTAVGLAIAWLLVVGCAMLSVRTQTFTNRQRWFWILTIVFLPGIGLLCYLPFSLTKERPEKLYRGKHHK